MNRKAIDEIIERCNQLNKEIGKVCNTTLDTNNFCTSILTTGDYILQVSSLAIKDQESNCLSDKKIQEITERAKRKK